METYTNARPSTYIAILEKELILATSSIRNLRNMMSRRWDDGYDVMTQRKSKWSRCMRSEAAILRNRIDTMMGTVTIILSMCASEENFPVKISAESCKKALTACAIEEKMAAEVNLENSLSQYNAMVVQFVNDLAHGDEEVSWQRAAEYLQRSLALSSMLTVD